MSEESEYDDVRHLHPDRQREEERDGEQDRSSELESQRDRGEASDGIIDPQSRENRHVEGHIPEMRHTGSINRKRSGTIDRVEPEASDDRFGPWKWDFMSDMIDHSCFNVQQVLYWNVLRCTVLCCTAIYSAVLYCAVFLSTVLHCTALCCTRWYCIALHRTTIFVTSTTSPLHSHRSPQQLPKMMGVHCSSSPLPSMSPMRLPRHSATPLPTLLSLPFLIPLPPLFYPLPIPLLLLLPLPLLAPLLELLSAIA